MVRLIVRLADRTGRSLLELSRYAVELLVFLYTAAKTVWLGRGLGHRDFVREVGNQIYFTGVQAIPPVMIIALAAGVLAIAQGVSGVGALSSTDDLGRLVTVLVVRELAPLVTGIVVIARSVTAVSAELGLMRVHREVEALEAMGIPPMRNLVAPRLIGGVTAITGLAVMFAAGALVGGYLVSRVLFAYVPAPLFFGAVLTATSVSDVLTFLVKTCLGGLGLFLVACYHGMDVASSPAQVPVAVSRAARHGLIFLLVLHGVIDLWTLNPGTRGSVASLLS
jgi:phospholipid/cholesterol/gamma-HCH transport system permease protein